MRRDRPLSSRSGALRRGRRATPPGEDLAGLAAGIVAVYERQAVRFDADRSRSLFERAWLERFLALVRPGGRVLDVGCGAGEPIAAFVAGAGHPVTGIDAAQAMLVLARARAPLGDWRVADMHSLDLGRRFAGVVAWDSFFHLTPGAQRETLPRLAAHLEPGAPLMLTVGPAASEVVGSVGGEPVYSASLAPAEYRALLDGLGLDVLAFEPDDPGCDRHSVLLARAREDPS
ncbi:MAG: class I SAM-dependent methyltransferase [Salinarimonas sp.]